MFSILLETLKQYNIEYNITRDNTSSNDTVTNAHVTRGP
jgi:hypothetical protein